jgi:hypothetical protein
MKSALCLSGQPKGLLECSDSIIKNIIEPNNCDVFIHTWWNPNDVGKLYRNSRPEFKSKVLADLPDKLTQIYKPQSMIIEEQVQFPYWVADSKYQPGDKGFVFAIQSMFYSIKMSNLLKSIYENQLNQKYDYVMRSRFDLYYHEPILFDFLPIDQITTKNSCTHTNYCVADHWAVSSSENMDIYANTFNNIYKMYSEGIIWCGELFLGKQLLDHKLTVNNLDIRYDLLEKT